VIARTPASPALDPSANAQSSAATFLVRGIFVLGTRSLFIVRGTVLTGTVRGKQRVIGTPGMDAEVESVEARLLDVSGGAEQTALTFRYAKQAQLAQWSSLVAEGTILTLGEQE
jgi:hypothetical protein